MLIDGKMKKKLIVALFGLYVLACGLWACAGGQPATEQANQGAEIAADGETVGTEAVDTESAAGGALDGGSGSGEAAGTQASGGETEDSALSDGQGAAGTAEAANAEDAESAKIDARVEELLSSMSIRDKIEQMMVVAFRVWEEPITPPAAGDGEASGEAPAADDAAKTVENIEAEPIKENVTALNEALRASFREHHFGGTILFAQNIENAEQTLRLIMDIQKTSTQAGAVPLFIAADQEGGNVSRLSFGTAGPGNMALAATGDAGNAKRMASIYGEELALLGINTDFAPVADINNNPANPIIGVRSFSDDPEEVAEYTASFLSGLREQGIITTAKHFPGHGNTETDSHSGFPVIGSTYEELKEFELVPFKRAIAEGVDMIMTAHIQYPLIETQTRNSVTTGEEVYLPATMSKTLLTDILRGDMGFDGLIVSDQLDMGAITNHFSAEDVLTLTINSGVDILLMPNVMNAEEFRKFNEMVELAVKLAEGGKIDPERIDASVRRILKLKARYGILDQTDFEVTPERIQAAEVGTGSPEHIQTARELSVKALTLVKNEKEAFPLDLSEKKKVLILFADSCASRGASGDEAVKRLKEAGKMPEGVEISSLVCSAKNENECLQAAKKADHVILVYRTYGMGCLDPADKNGLSLSLFDRVIDEQHKRGRTVLLVSCQLPYDAAYFQQADGILLAYNSAAMKELPPASGEEDGYLPNLVSALQACLGEGNPEGRLPVSIPEMDGNHQFTDRILYPKGYSVSLQ